MTHSITIQFESDFQKKILYISFPSKIVLAKKSQIDDWKKQWIEVLKSWHSPYKALIDFSNVEIQNSEEIFSALKKMFDFFERFFLRKIAAWGISDKNLFKSIPCDCVETEEDALKILGLRERKHSASEDFRSQIHIDNHFEQQSVELSFLSPSLLTVDKLAILRSKLTNNLMLWHSQWSLIVDCSQLEIPDSSYVDFEKMLKFLKGFFLQDIVGYSPTSKDAKYPFTVYRSRHKAAAHIKGSGLESGRDAHCKK